MTTWTRFMDMHSGGGRKASHEYIYIEADEAEAIVIFYNRFGHNPHRVSCTCCGEDYCISSGELAQLTAYDRGCTYRDRQWIEEEDTRYRTGRYRTLEQYRASGEVLFISASEITPEQRIGEVPEQGYIWKD